MCKLTQDVWLGTHVPSDKLQQSGYVEHHVLKITLLFCSKPCSHMYKYSAVRLGSQAQLVLSTVVVVSSCKIQQVDQLKHHEVQQVYLALAPLLLCCATGAQLQPVTKSYTVTETASQSNERSVLLHRL